MIWWKYSRYKDQYTPATSDKVNESLVDPKIVSKQFVDLGFLFCLFVFFWRGVEMSTEIQPRQKLVNHYGKY